MAITAIWDYADWVTQATDALKLSQLNLHIIEVSQAMKGIKSRTGADFPVHFEYYEQLIKEKAALEIIVTPDGSAAKAALGVATSKSRFFTG